VISHINDRCNAWADWIARKLLLGTGYPRECVYTRLQARGGSSGFELTIDEQAWEIHQAVKTLPPQLLEAINAFYLGKGTVDDKAKDCRCHRDTLFVRVHRAHIVIMDWLYAEAAGLHKAPAPAKSALHPPTVSV